jgi:hypothetical protein
LLAQVRKPLEAKPGTQTPITIKIDRKENTKSGVSMTAVRLANGLLSTKSVFVQPEKDEAEITLMFPGTPSLGGDRT